ncbi:MAG: transposase [Myxococcaceae bacterium]
MQLILITGLSGEGKSADTLKKFFAELGPERTRKLTHITMDMSAAFVSAVEEVAPQAEKVFDRFHVQRLASDAVDEVRRSEVREVAGGTEAAQALKKTRWALLKSPFVCDFVRLVPCIICGVLKSAMSWSGGRKRPRRSAGGTTAFTAASFSVGSARAGRRSLRAPNVASIPHAEAERI